MNIYYQNNVDNNEMNVYRKKYIKRLIKWLKYIPSEWNIEEVLELKAKELSSKDLEHLQRINIDLNFLTLLNEIDNYEQLNNNEKNKLENILNIDLDILMEYKLSNIVLSYCNREVKKYSSSDDILNKLEKYRQTDIEKRSFVADYISYKLEVKYEKALESDLSKKEKIKSTNIK